jgi:GNAT superfamily N-acetyltransferase
VVSEACEVARAAGKRFLSADPHLDNEAAVSFWRAVGFQVVAHGQDDGSPCLLMRLTLTMPADVNARTPASAAADGLVVSRASEEQWSAVRAVRLAALTESPSAFGASLQREQEYDEPRWREWVRSAAVFLVWADDVPVGLAAGVPGETDESRKLVAVWIDTGWRGRGASPKLLDGVESWARAGGAQILQLWLTQGNVPARQVYERFGFVDTGRSKPLPSNPALQEDEMVLRLYP